MSENTRDDPGDRDASEGGSEHPAGGGIDVVRIDTRQVILYDLDREDAWLQSDVVLSLAEHA